MYEAFEYQPTLQCVFEAQLDEDIPPVTETELREMEGLLRRTRRKRKSLEFLMHEGPRVKAKPGDRKSDIIGDQPTAALPHVER